MSVIGDYLQSVRNKFIDYKEFLIVDLKGDLLATSDTAGGTPPEIPHEWISEVRAGQSLIGEAYFDPGLGTRVIVIGAPIRSAANELLGVLAAKLSVRPIDAVLSGHANSDTDAVFLINSQGRMLTCAAIPFDQPINKFLDPQVLNRLLTTWWQI